jgi:hypothetical protein
MITRQEIIDYAARYVAPEEIGDFPFEGDVFCLLSRKLTGRNVLKEEEGWGFLGYGICSGYTLDSGAKPAGKWLWMHFVSLATFPPSPQTIKLQPPHVVRGRFHDPARAREFRTVKVDVKKSPQAEPSIKSSAGTDKSKIIPFRRKG